MRRFYLIFFWIGGMKKKSGNTSAYCSAADTSRRQKPLRRSLRRALPLIAALISLNADAQRDSAASIAGPALTISDSGTGTTSLASRFAIGGAHPVKIPDSAIAAETTPWLEMRVRRGDTIGALFERYKLQDSTWREVLALGREADGLAQLRTGDKVRVRTDRNGRLLELMHQVDDAHSLRVMRVGDQLKTETVLAVIEQRTNYATAVIDEEDGSVFLSAQKAGLSDRVIMQMFEIFRWDVDFAQDIQPGDRFSVVFEEIYRNGERLRDGNVLAAEFTGDGKTLRAVRYTDRKGDAQYYTPSGAPLHKAFIRTPVAFTRISSYFGRRRHPILNRIRNHKGVDYAAPSGTPIKTAGDGRIVFRGRKGGYGNCILVQHANGIQTMYGHMSRFSRGQSLGSHVAQGQIIGYVGKTGLATGPHLHYEFRVKGMHMNPLTVKLPGAAPLPPSRRVDFVRTTAPLIAQLDSLRHIEVAKADD